jgi:hypothetical protein
MCQLRTGTLSLHPNRNLDRRIPRLYTEKDRISELVRFDNLIWSDMSGI